MCVISAKHFHGVGFVLVKNRDRNYKPSITIRQSFRNGIERLFLYDEKTKYTEGVNEFGIGILSAAVSVKFDEKEGGKAEGAEQLPQKNFASPDGFKIRKALYGKTVKEVVDSLIDLELPGNTFVASKTKCVLLEGAVNEEKEYFYKTYNVSQDESIVRTNHGILIKSGYNPVDNPDEYKSSEARYKQALKDVKKCSVPEDMLNAISDTSNKNKQLNPLRQSKTHGKHIMVTTGQIMLNPGENTLHYRSIWCNMELSNFNRINNTNKSKCFYEIVSTRKLLTMKEEKENKMKSKFDELFESAVCKKEDEIVEPEVDATDEIEDDEIVIDEKDVKSKEDLTGFAMSIASKAFGNKVDKKKVEAIVDGAIEKSDGDWGKAVGIVSHSFTK